MAKRVVEKEMSERCLKRHPVGKAKNRWSLDQQEMAHLRLRIDAEKHPRTDLQILPVMADPRHRLLIKTQPDFRQHLLKHGAEEIPLVGELVIKRAACDASLADNFLRADCAIASLREKAAGGCDQLFPVAGRLLGRGGARQGSLTYYFHTACMNSDDPVETIQTV